MNNRAHITSVEAIAEFRSSLITYLTRAGQALDEVDSEVKHTRQWLDQEQRSYWKREAQRRADELAHARERLLTAKIATFRDRSTEEQLAVTRAKKALQLAEDKQRKVKEWRIRIDTEVEPLLKHLSRFRNTLATDMPQAIAFLHEALTHLDAYQEERPAASVPSIKPVENSDHEH